MDEFLGVLFRWLHIIPACLAIGGVFFMRFILPAGLKLLEPQQQKAVYLRCRRVFKFVIHASILLFLVSGTYNAIGNWQKYKLVMPTSHIFFGLHLILALAVFTISIVLLAGKEPPAKHGTWMTVNLVLLLLVVVAASTLKWVRDHAPATSAAAQTK